MANTRVLPLELALVGDGHIVGGDSVATTRLVYYYYYY
jgi:hypothetical protein